MHINEQGDLLFGRGLGYIILHMLLYSTRTTEAKKSWCNLPCLNKEDHPCILPAPWIITVLVLVRNRCHAPPPPPMARTQGNE